MKYNAPYNQPDVDAAYVNGNPSTGTAGSIPPAESIEYPQRELVDFITKSGVTPANTDLGQLAKASQTGKITYAVDTGSANAIAFSASPIPGAYTAGMTFNVKVAATNTGATVANANGLGNKTVKRPNGQDLQGGDILLGGMARISYDGTNFQLVSFNGSTLPRTQKSVFTSSGTFTATVAGVHKFSLWGAGGGGGGSASGLAGSGGSAGVYAEVTKVLATGETVAVVVGSGGTSGLNSGTNGGAGGSSTVTIGGVTFTAGGGPGGISNASSGSTNSPGVGTATGSFDRVIVGGQGGPGYLLTSPTAAGGYGGSAALGGLGGVGGGGASGAGAIPGGGGGGNANAQTTAAGARGEVWVEY